jgi:hypothetical protein
VFDNFFCLGAFCGGAAYAQTSLPGSPFTFTFNPNLNGAGAIDTLLDFEVHTIDGRPLITDLEIFSSATGIVNDNVEVCNNPSNMACLNKLVLTTVPLSPPAGGMFNFAFAPQSTIFVQDDISVPQGATGNISSLTKQISQVPEPASLAILAVSLLGMGAAFRRHRRR